MTEVITNGLLLMGAALILIGGVGLLRFPDVFMRLSAVTKVMTLGVGCLVVAAAVHFQETAVTTRAAVVVVFFFLTSPVSAHMIGRAAYLRKTPLWNRTEFDELQGRYDLAKGSLESMGEEQQPTKSPAD
jgi:multicomponent Na+:H+ antiporter subunit G